ncbi:hypothetical protein BDA96_03G197800 [Sorghum bicolor]|uniref:Uncharacterized protein n=1 Tax=Sorghum bicolor TaxID=4558 RepID=A0A921RCN7_SORBI|nr:hypothetical protein BDA96_03G197800 [Sorghum bicolor]
MLAKAIPTKPGGNFIDISMLTIFSKVLLSREGFSSYVCPKCVGDRLTYMGDRQERRLGMVCLYQKV